MSWDDFSYLHIVRLTAKLGAQTNVHSPCENESSEPKLAIFVQGTQTPGVVQLDLNLPGLGIHFYTKNAIIAIELFHLHWVVMFFNYLP